MKLNSLLLGSALVPALIFGQNSSTTGNTQHDTQSRTGTSDTQGNMMESKRAKASHAANDLLNAASQARSALQSGDRQDALTHINHAIESAEKALAQADGKYVPIYMELSQYSAVGPIIAERDRQGSPGGDARSQSSAANANTQRQSGDSAQRGDQNRSAQVSGADRDADRYDRQRDQQSSGQQAASRQSTGQQNTGQQNDEQQTASRTAQQQQQTAGQQQQANQNARASNQGGVSPTVQQVVGRFTSVNLDVETAREHLQAAKDALNAGETEKAEAALAAVHARLRVNTVATELPLVRARQNLVLARLAAVHGDQTHTKAALKEVSDALQAYERGSGAKASEASSLRNQIDQFASDSKNLTSSAVSKIDNWWDQVTGWTPNQPG